SAKKRRIPSRSTKPLAHEPRQVRLATGAVMADHLGGADRPQPQAFLQRAAANVAEQETGGELVARTGGIDDVLDRLGGDFGAFARCDRDRALLAASDDEYRNPARKLLDPRVEIDFAGQRRQFMLVGEQDVDQP